MNVCIWPKSVPSRCDLKWLRRIGVTSILCYRDILTTGVIEDAKWSGLKVIVQWPDWRAIGLMDHEYALRNHLGDMGRRDRELDNISGPSYWYPHAVEQAAETVGELQVMGIDGVLVTPRYDDCIFPLEYMDADNDGFRGNSQFWSFDKWAVAAWGGAMPTHSDISLEGTLETDHDFYRWYQSGWQQRLLGLTEVVLEVGFRDLYIWHLPLQSLTLENVALGSFDAAWVYDSWQWLVTERGGVGTIICCNLLGSNVVERNSNTVLTLKAKARHGWRMMMGAQIDMSTQQLETNLVRMTEFAETNGMGLFGSGRYLLQQDQRNTVFSRIEGLWL